MEKVIIENLKKGDEQAFRWLVDHYRNRIYYSVINILYDAEEAEDTVQDTFIQVYESIKSFNGDSSLATWIYRIAVRKALEKLRRQKTRKQIFALMPWWMPQESQSFDAVHLNPGIELENKEKAIVLFRAMESLPNNQRIAFNLIQVQGMSYAEVCGIMQLSVKATESLISRAKENLRKKLISYYKEINPK
jgi:RNA polymerase sigma factor (sigma-70 family)